MGTGGDASGVASSFTTEEKDLGVMGEKILIETGLCYKGEAPLTVRLVFDGEMSPAVYTLPPKGAVGTVHIRPYAKKFEKIALSVASEGAFTAEGFFFRYI